MLIIGCGNPDRGDDAAGLLVARRLRRLGVNAREHSGEALALIDSWQGADAVILIDTVMSGAPPGSLIKWNAATGPPPAVPGGASTHGFGIAEAVALARTLNRLPPSLVIYGIEGRSFELGSLPGEAVASAIERLAQHLAQHPVDPSPGTGRR